jgi:DNA-nicking Smr family endonuclease
VSFGDVLKDWDNLKKEEHESKRAKGEAAKSGSRAGPADEARPDGDLIRRAAPTTREQVMAYLNRYGTEDKDQALDLEAEEESLARTERDRLAKLRPEGVIDLHGMTAEAALDSLGLFLEDSRRRGYRKVLIIHGKGNHSGGDPVLKRAVLRFLESYPGAGRSGSADKASGGNGATWLILKR